MDRYLLKVYLDQESGDFLETQILKEDLTLSELISKALMCYKESLNRSPDEV